MIALIDCTSYRQLIDHRLIVEIPIVYPIEPMTTQSTDQSIFHAGPQDIGQSLLSSPGMHPVSVSVHAAIKHLTFGDLRQVEFILISRCYWDFMTILFNFSSNFFL